MGQSRRRCAPRRHTLCWRVRGLVGVRLAELDAPTPAAVAAALEACRSPFYEYPSRGARVPNRTWAEAEGEYVLVGPGRAVATVLTFDRHTQGGQP